MYKSYELMLPWSSCGCIWFIYLHRNKCRQHISEASYMNIRYLWEPLVYFNMIVQIRVLNNSGLNFQNIIRFKSTVANQIQEILMELCMNQMCTDFCGAFWNLFSTITYAHTTIPICIVWCDSTKSCMGIVLTQICYIGITESQWCYMMLLG